MEGHEGDGAARSSDGVESLSLSQPL